MKRVICAAIVMACVFGSRAWAAEQFWGQKWGSAEDKIALTQKIYTRKSPPKTPRLDELKVTDTVSQYGITWKFDKKVRVGRFITGDWYFVGPSAVVEITPQPLFGNQVKDLVEKGRINDKKFPGKYARNGSVLNQPVNGRAGYDSRMPQGYDPSLFAHLPIQMKPGDSLISSISHPLLNKKLAKRVSGHLRVFKSMAVLTCVDAPQPPDTFRPSYCDTKNKVYLARNLRRELLYRLPKPRTVPILEVTIRRIHRPWIDVMRFNYSTAEENQPRYGQWYTHTTSKLALMVHLDFKPEEKEALLIHYVQYGIDLWGVIRAGWKGWTGFGGFGDGRKWPVVFGGIMLGDEEMTNIKKTYPKVTFGADMKSFRGKSYWGHNVVFNPKPIRVEQGRWKVHPDTQDPKDWPELGSEGYRRCCTSKEYPGMALAARMMRAEKIWGHDPFFDYVDRWMTEDHIAELKAIVEASKFTKNWKLPSHWARKAQSGKYVRTYPFFQEMWHKYRNNLPPAKTAAVHR